MKKILTGVAVLCIFASCNNTQGWFGNSPSDSATQKLESEGSYKAKFARDASITKENAYSDLFLDSIALETYLKSRNVTGNKAERMREFYRVRNNGFAWFTSAGLTEQARSLWSLSAGEENVNGEGSKKENEPAARLKSRMDSLLTNDSALVVTLDTTVKKDWSETGLAEAMAAKDSAVMNTELALTEQLVQLASEGNGVITEDNLYWLVPRKKVDALQWADSLLNRGADSALGNNHPHYAALKRSLKLYYDAAKNGGWPQVASAKGLKKGAKSPAVTQLKKRLAATGDYSPADTSNVFTDSLLAAVKAVQEQFGFAPTGIVTDSLLAELYVPASERVQQILVNMNRALWTKPVTDSSRIWVNVPSLQLVAYGHSGRTLQMPVIVGKEGTGTMAFSGEISKIVFSPYWNIPQSIVKNEIVPAMKADASYLKKHNMEIVNQNGDLPEIRQLPGKDNSLGQVKFLFPNSFDIYLHDTPHKELFAQADRALSHGCIRVAKPDSLALFLLRGQNEWTPEKINAAMNSGKEQTVEVKRPAPVAITYYTVFADAKERLHFRKDVYGYDRKTASQMFANTGAPTPA